MTPHVISLDLLGPLHFPSMLEWLRARAIPGLEVVSDTTYTRTLRLTHGAGVCAVSQDGNTVRVELLLEHGDDREEAMRVVRRLVDADADIDRIDAQLCRDPRIAKLVAARPGMRIPGLPNLTEAVTRAILGQQITVVQARNQVETLVHALGDPLPADLTAHYPQLTYLFPSASSLEMNAVELLRGPQSRKDSLTRATSLIAEGTTLQEVGGSPDDLMNQLQKLKGIGPWTAGYVAFRLLGAPDIFLTGDVAMMGGGRAIGLGETKPEIMGQVASLAPYRSYLMLHLWQYARDQRQKR